MIKPFQFSRLVVLCCLLLVCAGCAEKVPQISIDSAEAVLSPALIGVASVFMRINNTGGADDVLTGARADIPGVIAELHDIEDGKMVVINSIAVSSDSSILLRPARQHIMLLKLPRDLKEGSRFNLILSFKKSGERVLSLELTKFDPGNAFLLRK